MNTISTQTRGTTINLEDTIVPHYQAKRGYLDLKLVTEAFYRDEMGDSDIFAHLFAGRVVFDHSLKKWYLWNSQFWEKESTSQVVRLISHDVAAQYLHAAAEFRQTTEDPKDEWDKQLYKRARSLNFKNRINNVLTLATSHPHLAITGSEWDCDPMLLGVPNGTIDLRTGELRNGSPRDYIRTTTGVIWKSLDEPAPRWERFLEEIFDYNLDLIRFVQKMFGYGIIGMQKQAIFPVFWGEGRNGKDTLLETLLYVCGRLSSPVGADVLLDGKRNIGAASPNVYRLRDLRLAWVNETSEGAWLNAGQVKMLTGGGTITARPLYSNPVEFRPRYLLLLVTNSKPRVRANDYALWKRILLIPFNLSFVDDPKADFERKCDPDLLPKLKREGSGVLAWLVRGCLLWQKEGLNPPATVKEATKEYQETEDFIGQFLDQSCTEDPNAITLATDLYQAYCQWTLQWGLPQISGTAFGLQMGKRFRRKRKPGDGRNQYEGVKLITKK